MDNKTKTRLPKPKLALDRLSQVVYTFRQVTKLAARVNLKVLILLFLFNALWGFSSLPGFYLEKLILDKLVVGIGNPKLSAVIQPIMWLIIARLILELIRSLLSRLGNLNRTIITFATNAALDAQIGQQLAGLDMATIEDPEFKNKFTRIEREANQRVWGMMMPLADIPNYLIGFLSVVGLLFLLHPLVTVGIVIFSIPQFLIDHKFIKKEYQLETKLAPLYRVWNWLTNYLTRNKSYPELKILNLSTYLTEKLKGVQKEAIDQYVQLRRQREMSRFGSFIPLSILELVVSVWLVFLVIVERITVGSFEMYLRALRSAQNNLSGLVSAFIEIYENYMFVNDLVWFLNLKPKINDQISGIKLKNQEKYSISFQNVWFKYRTDQPWVLKNLNLEIQPGDRLAIVGENGVGKSTLVKLIA